MYNVDIVSTPSSSLGGNILFFYFQFLLWLVYYVFYVVKLFIKSEKNVYQGAGLHL